MPVSATAATAFNDKKFFAVLFKIVEDAFVANLSYNSAERNIEKKIFAVFSGS